jgi:tetratricopeptide (TPR) repeat protein
MKRRRAKGEWRLSQPPSAADLEREWSEVVAPVLPAVRDKLWANLLLGAIWDNVLDERQRRMLWRMTLLRRPWDWGLMVHLGEADEEAAVAEATAEELCRTSLLEAAEMGEVPHYTLHPATAMYVCERHSDNAALRLETHLSVGAYLEEQAKSSRWVETKVEGGHHLFKASEYNRACELLVPASDWLRQRGRVREGLLVLEPFLDEGVQPRIEKRLVGRLLITAGLAYHLLGQPQRALGFYEQLLAIVREGGDRPGETRCLCGVGHAYREAGQPQLAIELFQQALDLARATVDHCGASDALNGLGLAHSALGKWERAIEYYEQALAIARESADRRRIGNALGNLSRAYTAVGQPERAIENHQEDLAIAREISEPRSEGIALHDLGLAHAALGQWGRAIELYEQALAIARNVNNRRGEGLVLNSLGHAYAALGNAQKAIGIYAQALAIAQEVGDGTGKAKASWNLGNALVKLDRLDEAIPLMADCALYEKQIGHADAGKHAAKVEQLRQHLAGG